MVRRLFPGEFRVLKKYAQIKKVKEEKIEKKILISPYLFKSPKGILKKAFSTMIEEYEKAVKSISHKLNANYIYEHEIRLELKKQDDNYVGTIDGKVEFYKRR